MYRRTHRGGARAVLCLVFVAYTNVLPSTDWSHQYQQRPELSLKEQALIADVARAADEGKEIPAMTSCGPTIDLAARYRYPELVKKLIEKGINPTSRTVQLAIFVGEGELVTFLLKRFPDLARVDDSFGTPLHCASFYNRAALIGPIAACGVDINASNILQNTALHIAVELGYADVVGALCHNGANPFVKNNKNIDALDIAYQRLEWPKKTKNSYEDFEKREEFTRIVAALSQNIEKFGGKRLAQINFSPFS